MLGVVHLGKATQCPRAQRLADELSAQTGVRSICEDDGPAQVVVKQFSTLGRLLNLLLLVCGRFDSYLRRKYALQGELPVFDAGLVCHDLLLLPLIMDRCGRSDLVVDVREYYPRQFEQSWFWRLTSGRLNHYLCTRYLPAARACVTVSPEIAQEYRRNYGVTMEVIPSYAKYHNHEPSRSEGVIKLVHHGNASPNRHLVNMLQMMDHLSLGYQLDLYLVPKEADYYAMLVAEVATRPNVALHQPLPFECLIGRLHDYDIGLFVPPASTFNLDHALPNKLFEYVQARLMIVVSPLATAAAFVRHWQVGEVSASATPEALAQCVADISVERLGECKARTHELAAEMNSAAFAQAFVRVLGG